MSTNVRPMSMNVSASESVIHHLCLWCLMPIAYMPSLLCFTCITKCRIQVSKLFMKIKQNCRNSIVVSKTDYQTRTEQVFPHITFV